MNKKFPSLILFVLLLLSIYVPAAVAHVGAFPSSSNPDAEVLIDTIGEPETLDPAWCYDTASAEIIFNVYETLLFYDVIYPDGPYTAGKYDVFYPQLATEFSVQSGPAPYVKTFYFKIRGVGTEHTFVATGTAGAVDLLKDGQIYGGSYFVRDPDYGLTGNNQGPITTATDVPTIDGNVDRAVVPANAYTGALPGVGETLWDMVEHTTWMRQDGPASTRGGVISSVTDVNGNGILDAGDKFDVVQKCFNHPKGPWWNVREYWTVKSVDSTSPYTITTEDDPVYFHDGVSTLTPADVEYSFERWMVQDRSGGPLWMFIFPVLGEYYALSPAEDPNFGDKINNAIGSNATHAWISLTTDFPETTFLQILSQSWASILKKDWCVAKGDFDGNWAAGWASIYATWHDPSVSFIEDDMMGTGPYEFDYWEHGTAYSIVKFDDYWNGWPAYNSPTSTERLPGFLSRATWNMMISWTTRQMRFLAGDVDYTYVPRQYRDQVLGQRVGGELIRCNYPVEPSIAVDANFYNFEIGTSSSYLGSGFDPADPHRILENRIPTNLFDDVNVRNGFTSAFDLPSFITAAYLGEAAAPSDPIIPGLSYDNVAQAGPVYDMTKAAEYLKAAWVGHPDDNLATPEGALWDKGMTFDLLYNEGNVARETAANMLANSLMSLNSKFHVNVKAVAWGSTYLPQMVAGLLPSFIIGWLVDYPDPDNFAFPFMHTYGTFSAWQAYSNPRVDALIEAGALMPMDSTPYNGELDLPDPRVAMNNYNATEIAADPTSHIPPDTRWPRRSIYYELQALYVEDCPGFCLDQALGRHWEQPWMRGWYFNPVYPGGYGYQRWKTMSFGDVNNNGIIDVYDSGRISYAWTKPAPTSSLGLVSYLAQSDQNGGTGGTTGSESGTVIGIPDGKVDVVDSALTSAYWTGA